MILRLRSSPSTTTTLPPAASTSDASSVPSGSPACAARRAPARNACGRLHRHDARSRSTVPPPTSRSVSDDGDGRDRGVGARRDGGQHPLPHLGHRHRASRVVHDDRRRRRRGRRPGPPAPTPSGWRRPPPRPSRQRLRLIGHVGRHHEHHAVGVLGRGAERPVEHSLRRRGAGTACAGRTARRCRRPRRSPRWTCSGRYRP